MQSNHLAPTSVYTQEEDKLSVKERSGLTSHMLNTPLRDKKREKNHSSNS